jgi:hypothetical protein
MKSSFPPTSHYTVSTIRNRRVFVNNDLLAKENITAKECLALLDYKMYEIDRIVPGAALDRIRHVPIWLEQDSILFPGGVYHPSQEWLIANNMNPEKAKAIEFGNAKTLLVWSIDQPMLLIHEFSHAYHHQVLGYDNADVRAAFDRAKESRIYEDVLHSSGRMGKAYAMENEQEYFAELSESYFGSNDIFPFVRAEIQKHDPKMYILIETVWAT